MKTWYVYGTLYPGAEDKLFISQDEAAIREIWDLAEAEWKDPKGSHFIEDSNWGHGLYKVELPDDIDAKQMNHTDLRYYIWFTHKDDERLTQGINWEDWGEDGIVRGVDYYHWSDDEDDDTVYWNTLPEGFMAEILELYREPYKGHTVEELDAWSESFENDPDVMDLGEITEEEYQAELEEYLQERFGKKKK